MNSELRAHHRFPVRAALPDELAQLDALAGNLRWAWHAPTRELFRAVDPELWDTAGHSPPAMLAAVSSERLSELAADSRFRQRLDEAHADLVAYLQRPSAAEAPAVAYFSPEFGVTEHLPLYSGGLGILAGDHLKSASDLGVPLVGVGLLYRSGYFIQRVNADGWQEEHYRTWVPGELGLTPLPVEPIVVELPAGRRMQARVWVAQVGRVPLLLLDTDVEGNDEDLRAVTDRLYGGDNGNRLYQELLLGIGGVRAVRAYCWATGAAEPAVYHSNEGHAGFLGLERIRELVAAGLGFEQALRVVRAGTVFTTHTPVPAGIDRFDRDQIAEHLTAALPGLPVERCLDLGAEPDPEVFNMAHMGLRLAQRCNGVSELHGALSRSMFAPLWPGLAEEDVPITHVTNGVHADTWAPIAPDPRLQDDMLTAFRLQRRSDLVDAVRARLRADVPAAAERAWIDRCLDPEVLTIGFARRVPTYKRLTLMLADPDRLRRLLTDPDRPIQLIVAGKAHPADDEGKGLIQQFVRFARDPELRRRVVFVPDYDMALARHLVAGCDVWLNNPLRPLEACGTSGMKVSLNGGLNLSIGDGWWAECYDPAYGWAIPTHDGAPEDRDALEAAALYDLLENDVVPQFYDDPAGWLSKVRATLRDLRPRLLADRMVTDYLERLYRPAAANGRLLAADDHAAADRLTAWVERLGSAWPEVRVRPLEPAAEKAGRGEELTLAADVDLGPLGPEDVEVRALYGPVDGEQLVDPVSAGMVPGETPGRFEVTVSPRRAGTFGFTVEVTPHHPLLLPGELGLSRLPEGGPC